MGSVLYVCTLKDPVRSVGHYDVGVHWAGANGLVVHGAAHLVLRAVHGRQPELSCNQVIIARVAVERKGIQLRGLVLVAYDRPVLISGDAAGRISNLPV